MYPSPPRNDTYSNTLYQGIPIPVCLEGDPISAPEFRAITLADLPVNFLADVDTTGGNSGSPALDGRGRLVGLLFDGVWEDLCGDYLYSPPVSRSILVDVRYVLWYLDRIAGARDLLDELGIPAATP